MQKTINRILLIIVALLIGLLGYKTFKSPKTIEAVAVTTIGEKAIINEQAAVNISSYEFKEKVELIIKEYLINNPDIIISSLEELQKLKKHEMESQAIDYMTHNKAEIENITHNPVLGNPVGDAVIVAFYDYNCIHSKTGSTNINELIASDKGVKVILRPFPILGEASNYIAKIALAVNELFPSKFQAVHNALMEMKQATVENINDILAKQGIDDKKVIAESNNDEIKNIINNNADLAGKLRIQGVPTYVINGKILRGLIDHKQLQELINQMRTELKEQVK